MKFKPFLAVFAAAAMLTQTGCTGSDILLTLEASVAASEILVASLATAGKIPAADATPIEAAIADVPAAYTQTSTELASSDAPAVKTLKITAYFANALQKLNALPPEAQVYAIPVTQAINAFLNAINPPPAATGAFKANVRTTATAFPATGWAHQIARHHLSDVKTRALNLQIAIDNLKK
jgi:hypothetical protein